VHARFVRERVELGEVAIGEGRHRIYCLLAHRMKKALSTQKEMQSETASDEMLRLHLMRC
jgi:hypothetical protein